LVTVDIAAQTATHIHYPKKASDDFPPATHATTSWQLLVITLARVVVSFLWVKTHVLTLRLVLQDTQALVSKNYSSETSKDTKVSSSVALQKFVEMLADTQPERVESGRRQAEKWYKVFGNQRVGNTDEEEPKAPKLKEPEPEHDPYDMPEDQLIEKIRQAKRVEASAKRKREALEAIFESNKRRRYDLDDEE